MRRLQLQVSVAVEGIVSVITLILDPDNLLNPGPLGTKLEIRTSLLRRRATVG